MMLDNEVRVRLYEVLEGNRSLDDFEAWFVGRTWDERTDLVAHIDHLLAEKSLLDARVLMDELRELTRTIEVNEVPATRVTAATSETIRVEENFLRGNTTIRSRLELAGT